MLEKMGEFFDNRLDEYDAHQLNCIDSAQDFLRFTAECLPSNPESAIVDLGCGTGLELVDYFAINPTAKVTGIDMAPGMLNRLKERFIGNDMRLILGSYFDIPLEVAAYNAAVSVESLHHFTMDEKTLLYKKLRESLKHDGYFILTDYFSLTNEEEFYHRSELFRLKSEQGISDDVIYHYDTPLTVEHEIQCLANAGFSKVEVLKHWGATNTIKAVR